MTRIRIFATIGVWWFVVGGKEALDCGLRVTRGGPPVLAVAARGVGSTAGIDERTAQARCHSRRRQPTAH